VTPAYLRTKEADSGLVIDYRNWQLSLGRRFRSIKLWFVMRSFGIEGLQTHLRTGITQCEQLAKLISATEDFEIITPPSLALLSFRLNPASLQLSDEALNRLNAALQSRLAHNPNIVLTQTVLKAASSEIYCIRFALGQYRTTQKDVDEIWAVVVDEARLTLGGWKESGVALN
jgi:aromatic-L-amino-acid decarboxylase